MRSLPGSVAIIGFTGEEKLITKPAGAALFIWAVKCTAVLSRNRRPEGSWKVIGLPSNSGRRMDKALTGTKPRPLSKTKLIGRLTSRPRMRTRVLRSEERRVGKES